MKIERIGNLEIRVTLDEEFTMLSDEMPYFKEELFKLINNYKI